MSLDGITFQNFSQIVNGETFLQVKEIGERYVVDGIEGVPGGCCHEASHIVVPSCNDSSDTQVLVIDVGGTHTKVGLLSVQQNRRFWRQLADQDNDAFKNECSTSANLLEQFLRSLSKIIANTLQGEIVTGLGIVWSNQMIAKQFENIRGTRGITGIVTGIGAGGYPKGEWFLKGLSNGFDIGEAFLTALAEVDIVPSSFLIANDTIFTLTALPGADAGVVVSSGGNCTHVCLGETGDKEIYNAEIGTSVIVPKNLITEIDTQEICDRRPLTTLEEFCAGVWLASGFEKYLIHFDLIERTQKFTTHDMAKILIDQKTAQSDIGTVCKAIVDRASAAAALICYLSIFNQLSDKSKFSIALDSSMARHIPGYFDGMKKYMKKLLPENTEAALNLLSPTEVSVPMMGAGEAVLDLIGQAR